MYVYRDRSIVDLIVKVFQQLHGLTSKIHLNDAASDPDLSSESHFRAHSLLDASLLTLLIFTLTGCGGLAYNNSSSLTGTATLSEVSCGTQSIVGALTKACSVTLSAASTSAVTVTLKSSNAALRVPGSVTIPSGANSAPFNASSSSVNQSVAVTITGTLQGVSKSAGITIYPSAASVPILTNVSCTEQTLTGPTTTSCSVNLSAPAAGATKVALQSDSSVLTVPATVTIASGATSATFQVSAVAVSSAVTATLSASLNGVAVTNRIQVNSIQGSGTQHVVNLSWGAPSSLADLAGYYVYRSQAGLSAFQLLNPEVDQQTSYADATVVSGKSYDYEVRSVSLAGTQSAPSNITTVTIP